MTLSSEESLYHEGSQGVHVPPGQAERFVMHETPDISGCVIRIPDGMNAGWYLLYSALEDDPDASNFVLVELGVEDGIPNTDVVHGAVTDIIPSGDTTHIPFYFDVTIGERAGERIATLRADADAGIDVYAVPDRQAVFPQEADDAYEPPVVSISEQEMIALGDLIRLAASTHSDLLLTKLGGIFPQVARENLFGAALRPNSRAQEINVLRAVLQSFDIDGSQDMTGAAPTFVLDYILSMKIRQFREHNPHA